MAELLHQLIEESSKVSTQRTALKLKQCTVDYDTLWQCIRQTANGFCNSGLQRHQRVAIYLPKNFESVIAMFATTKAGGIFVPINPALKGPQVKHIINDCEASILITSNNRLTLLTKDILEYKNVNCIILIDNISADSKAVCASANIHLLNWSDLNSQDIKHHPVTADNIAALLYTSGSTGKPKGVILTHNNMVTGAKSVASYLNNTCDDIILAVLPFSFDYGFSQLSSAFIKGACVVLMEYLVPRDVINLVEKEKITGLAAIPPLWMPLANLDWPSQAAQSLRYITNSGGSMPLHTLNSLQKALPNSSVYLMYGLTEAFRSTYLPPDQLKNHPNSIGKAVPFAEVIVVRPDGHVCDDDEPGELVHTGPLVAQGYWNHPQSSAEIFKLAPNYNDTNINVNEIAVWSGDIVRRNKDGFLFFIGRNDDMIKTSGYRVSASELEDVLYQTDLISEAVVLGIPHPQLGQAIVVTVAAKHDKTLHLDKLLAECRQTLPNYMIPREIIILKKLPRNANGKFDRNTLFLSQQDMFQEPSA